MQRLFIIGHPRSGTTVVQAMLGRHPEIYTLPETFFFPRLYRDQAQRLQASPPPASRWRRRLQLSPKSARRHLARLSASLAQPRPPLTAQLTLRQATRCFAHTLDQAARSAGCGRWVEKTPLHLLYIREISREIEGARFIHVLRPGRQVIASTLDAHLRYPGLPFSSPLGQLIQQWNLATTIHARYMGQPAHHFVFHDRLSADPAGEWQRLCQFLDLDPAAPLADSSHHAVASLTQEPWKQQAMDGQVRATEDKSQGLFGPDLNTLLQQRLSSWPRLQQLHDQLSRGLGQPAEGSALTQPLGMSL